MRTIGVLALQGDFAAHARAVVAAGHWAQAVRHAEELDGLDALILPGGESSTMLKLLREAQLAEPLTGFCRSGRPVLGTCAGAILLAREVTSPSQVSLGVLDISIERNAYGRQTDSFIAVLDEAVAGFEQMEAVFIRAPVIRRTGPEVQVLARHGGHAVVVQQGPVTAATFHPEMTADTRLLERALEA